MEKLQPDHQTEFYISGMPTALARLKQRKEKIISTFMNKECLALLGCSLEDKIDLEYFVGRENFLVLTETLMEAKESKKDCECEMCLHSPQNELLWIYFSVRCIFQKEENSTFIVALSDITKQKLDAKVLDSIMHNQYEWMMLIDGVTGCISRYGETVEFPEYNLVRANFKQAVPILIRRFVYPYDVRRILSICTLENIESQLEKEISYDITYSMLDRFAVLHKKRLQFNYIDRKRKLILLTRTDVTNLFEDQERLNKKLSDALTKAEHANLAKSEFLSRMSHEIRTPMNAIMGMTAIAKDDIEDKKQMAECLDKIESSSQYLLMLINDILDMSRIENGKIVLKKAPFSLFLLKQEIDVIIKTQADAVKVNYTTKIFDGVKEKYIGDAIRIKQIFINILSNAVKFTKPGGRVLFSIDQIKEENGRATLEIIVKDTGIGISPEFMPHLFSPFSQEERELNSYREGTGLGLAIASSLVRLMNGNISVESVVGRGSTFTIRIKLKYSTKEGLQNHKPKITSSVYNFEGKKVLVVEDHPVNTAVVKRLLEKTGFEVDIAENGLEGVKKFEQSKIKEYFAILMDIRMPVMDGLTATTCIRKLNREDAKDVPIIAMSANAFDEDRMKSKQAGLNEHLAKPVVPKLLYATLEKYI